MNEASLLTSINESKKLLKEFGILEEYNTSRPQELSINKFSEEFIKQSQKSDYLLTYNIAMKNRDYDFLLTDDSFIQISANFSCDNKSIRYAFYENPRQMKTYDDFLLDFELGDDEEQIFLHEYEQYKAEAIIKNAITPIRYDYDTQYFSAIIHPISHIHIGHNNDLRLPLNKILTPFAFIMFILKNVYRKKWVSEIERNPTFKKRMLKVKNQTKLLEEEFFNEEEQKLLYLT